MARGDKAARERLLTSNLGLVRYLAEKYRGRGLEQEDLEQIGALGLLEAIAQFDPARGPLAPLASLFINRHLFAAVNEQGRTVRVPAYAAGPILPVVSLELPISSTSRREDTLHDVTPASTPTPEQEAERDETAAALNQALESLSKRERAVLAARHGFPPPPRAPSLKKLKPERLRQIELQALTKLRAAPALQRLMQDQTSKRLYCTFDGCEAPAFRGGRCNSHEMQRKRTGRLSEVRPLGTPGEQVLDRAARLLETNPDDDHAYELNRAALLRAAARWTASLVRKRKPKPKPKVTRKATPRKRTRTRRPRRKAV